MKRTVLFLILILVFGMFAANNSHAFWGKKKKAEPEVQKETMKEPVKQKPMMAEPEKAKPEVPVKAEVKPDPKKEMAAPAPVTPTISKEEQKKRAKQKELKDKMKKKIDGNNWVSKIMPMSGEGKQKQDNLIFDENQFYSESYQGKGFSASNYTITVKDSGAVVWETMQSAEDGKIVFWRGEINSDMNQMRGVLSVQKAPGDSESFSFISDERTPVKR